MPLTIIEQYTSDEALSFELQGSLDSDTAPQLDERLAEAITPTTRLVAFNMAGVSFISSAGLRVIFKTLKLMKARKGQVSVSQMSKGVKKVFEIVKIMPDLTVFGDQAEMDEYLEAIQRREEL
ncbi:MULTISPECIES: STAS domain-containing protein [Marinobacter]|jgi:anti-anti-sigma factor|uniref:Anti-sigma factor antagonist n=2 Tax=Marinobacter TaxID=2742 RepID=A0A137SEQ1_9GAMM|nr:MULTISPECIES: STAS domain-containing protein [Marinobacter]MDX5439057.1 STAS domain-containing protein [Alteromonadaceae bacterium]AMQ87992.1 anti-sigma F factor antagonist [Marinobacter sp. LQ44]KXO10914.1 Anti-sigma F factor antagonist (spoIIAA-2/ Anti-sigma B factor antagonist RsbV) [Marinobacter excellens LAMA 842]MCD1630721.1 STAS domain-containing protein [Marinobacter shengliensis]MDX5327646.1 STAS domain-containing protein [Marinobacter sp.]